MFPSCGDTWQAEEACEAIADARRLIAGALEGMVREGQLPRHATERPACKLFRGSAQAFSRL